MQQLPPKQNFATMGSKMSAFEKSRVSFQSFMMHVAIRKRLRGRRQTSCVHKMRELVV